MTKEIAIVGGGAAGLAAAVAAARCAKDGGEEVRVTVYEAADRVGKPILATGNGRCNYTNASIDPALFRNAEFVANVLTRAAAATKEEGFAFDGPAQAGLYEEPVQGFFRSLGLVHREEGEGRLYPATGKATTVVDVLRAALRGLGVREVCETPIKKVVSPEKPGQKYHLHVDGGRVFHADRVIWATGHRASLRALPEGVPTDAFRPVLGPLQTETRVVKTLDNIRVRAGVWLVAGESLPMRMMEPGAKDLHASVRASWEAWANQDGKERSASNPALWNERPIAAYEQGELLFRKYGVSGVCIFNLSRFAEPGDVLLIDFFPNIRRVDMEKYLFTRRKQLASSPAAPKSGITCQDMLRGLVLPLVGEALLKSIGLKPESPFTKNDVAPLANALKCFPLEVRGVGDEQQCQVRRGGVDVDALDPKTMELMDHPGLYVVGEAADVDAPCGGYNLHWAWASGILAGISAARS